MRCWDALAREFLDSKEVFNRYQKQFSRSVHQCCVPNAIPTIFSHLCCNHATSHHLTFSLISKYLTAFTAHNHKLTTLIGAGGKGGAARTYAIDRDCCQYFIRASAANPSITKFLLISAIASRRKPAPWWTTSSEIEAYKKQINEVLPDYYKAKNAADETLTVLGEEREGFEYVILRPGVLSDDEETGKVRLGRTSVKGSVSRGDVAEVSMRLLERGGFKGWLDLIGAEDGEGGSVQDEIERCIKEGVDTREGEDLEDMRKNVNAK